MSAHVIDGKAVAVGLRAALATRIKGIGFTPGLAVVLVGDNPASAVYVRAKDRAAHEVGIAPRTVRLAATTTQAELIAQVRTLNDDPSVDGILVQLPLPAGLDTNAVIDAIDPAKDVDGLTPTNAGLLASGRPGLVPCTPMGVMKLLAHAGVSLSGVSLSGVSLSGTRAVVLGRSVLVGRPVAALLTAANATVTIAHSHTRDLASECRRAEILVAAVGRPEMVRGDWVTNACTIIDVGINRLPDGRLVGDVAYNECATIAGAITPVPGGVGPMTIACLLENTLLASRQRRQPTP